MSELPRPYEYDKGENRRKHQGTDPEPKIVHEFGNEVGKCPRGFPLDTAQRLLDDAIPEYQARQSDSPFRLWNYHDGAVYQARPSDGGTTWHGWPVQASRIPREIRRQIEVRAEAVGEGHRLKQWLRRVF